jgi:hypothetical protein
MTSRFHASVTYCQLLALLESVLAALHASHGLRGSHLLQLALLDLDNWKLGGHVRFLLQLAVCRLQHLGHSLLFFL